MTVFARPYQGTPDDHGRLIRAKTAQGIERRRAMLDALRRAGGAMPIRDLADAVGVDANTLRMRHLPRLVRAGAVVRERGIVWLVQTGEGA